MLRFLESVDVAARSDDASVTARVSATAGLAVSVDRVDHHDEDSLTTQLRQAISDAFDEFHRACEDIRHDYHDRYGDPTGALPPRSRAELAGYVAELDDIVVVGRSESGATRVKRCGDGFIDVRIRPGTVSGLSHHAVQREIDTAIASAGGQYASEQSRLYRSWFPHGRIARLVKE